MQSNDIEAGFLTNIRASNARRSTNWEWNQEPFNTGATAKTNVAVLNGVGTSKTYKESTTNF